MGIVLYAQIDESKESVSTGQTRVDDLEGLRNE
jgi:hypothetical protein